MEQKAVYGAIVQVMNAMAKEGISKSRSNQQQGFKFRGIDDIYNALAAHLAAANLCILPRAIGRVSVERQSKNGGSLFSVIVKVEYDFVCSVDGSTHVVGPFYGEAMDSGDKATNKAMSAAFKYLCMEAFCIPTEGDNDADATTHEVKAPVKPAPGAKPQPKPQPAPAKAAHAMVPVEELPFPDAPCEEITEDAPASNDQYADCECEVGTLKAVAKPRQVGNSTKYSVKIDEKWFCTWSDTVAGTFDALRGKGVTVYYKVKTKGNFTDNVIEHIEEAQ